MQDKVERSAPDKVYAGIDVSKDRLDVALLPGHQTLQVDNNVKGFKALLKLLKPGATALVVVEAAGKYSKGIARFLDECGISVAVVNPYRSRKFADLLGKLAKTDKIDALVLTHYAQMVHPDALPQVSKCLEELKELMVARDAAVVERAACKNRLAMAHSKRLIRECKRQLKACSSHVERLEAVIEDVIKCGEDLLRRRDILMSIPGVGKTVTLAGC